MKLDILFEDNHVIVVKKPVGILSQADHTQDLDMLALIKNYIKEKYNKPGNVFLGLVHRLDRMVGGVMVFAKTSKAASRLSDQIRTHKVEKKYYAVVHNKTVSNATLENYLMKDYKNNKVSVVNSSHKDGKYSKLSFQRIDFKNNLSLIQIDLETGRPHQIRVQFSHIDHPLYGDKKYGLPHDKGDIALFAYSLSFYHPTKQNLLTFKTKPDSIFPFNIFQL